MKLFPHSITTRHSSCIHDAVLAVDGLPKCGNRLRTLHRGMPSTYPTKQIAGDLEPARLSLPHQLTVSVTVVGFDDKLDRKQAERCQEKVAQAAERIDGELGRRAVAFVEA